METLNLSGKNLFSDGNFNEQASIVSNIQDLKLDFSNLKPLNQNRVIFSKKGMIELNFKKEEKLLVPFKINLNNTATPIDNFAKTISVSSIGSWNSSNEDCSYLNFINNDSRCGKLTDFRKTSLSVEDYEGGFFLIVGDGICVTPNSNCTQKIEAEIKSKKTAQIFSKIMVSGVVNPLLGGVLLSGLLTSPDTNDLNFDHKVKVDVEGSKIYLNDKPIF